MDALEAIERDLAEVDAQIVELGSQRETLLQMRELAGRLSKGSTMGHTLKKRVIRDRVEPSASRDQPRSKRDTMRAITIQMEGTFTLNDLEAATELSKLKLAPTLTKQDWSACLWTFYKQGLLELVDQRRGNLPATYRLKVTDLSPPKSEKENEFPLQIMVENAIKAMEEPTFGRKDIYAKVVEMNPDHADRIAIESVSAVLNRISRFENSPVKTIKSGFGGNIYTLADKSP